MRESFLKNIKENQENAKFELAENFDKAYNELNLKFLEKYNMYMNDFYLMISDLRFPSRSIANLRGAALKDLYIAYGNFIEEKFKEYGDFLEKVEKENNIIFDCGEMFKGFY